MSTASPSAHKLLHLINAGLLLMIASVGIAAWDRLPARIPVHFRADGLPDRYTADRAELLIVFIAPWLLACLMYCLGALIPWFRRHPSWISVPNKRKFLMLPPEKQGRFWSLLSGLIYTMVAAVNLFFLTLICGILQVAGGRAERLPAWSTWPAMILLLAVLLIQAVRMIVLSYRLTS